MAPGWGIGDWFDRRQVAFGYMLDAARPCTVTEVLEALRRAQFVVTNKQVSDLLRQQVHRGRVTRVRAVRVAGRRGALPGGQVP